MSSTPDTQRSQGRGRGRGGRGRGGREGRWTLGRGSQKSTSTTGKFRGNCAELLGDVFDCANYTQVDKHMSAVEPYQELTLQDLDEQEQGHYHVDGVEQIDETDPQAQDLLVGAEVHLPRRANGNG